MKIETEAIDNSRIIYILGNLDTLNTPSVENELDKLLYALQEDRLVISLKNVKFVSSAGLRVLVKTFKECEVKGKRVFLAELNKPVEQAIKLLNLEKLFNIVPAVQDALA